ncbi:hypothetical protein [Sphingobium cloacae]|uniref:Uncharacterized protein n=1 Tax=Sphingobium cloacae TaxID=120107 RepID=A0A1E1F661_9SPHN|nr:hypothetical protein [Sphingobium cloacae]BAV66008.1 hypothetical protein SCLO_1029680 [Sphingobium cloacae]
MPQRRHSRGSGKGRPLFLATLWMAICVALLCAIAPLGLPSSKLTGSAFNPATTSVVLKARSPAAPQAKRLAGPDGAGLVPLPIPNPFHFAISFMVLPVLCWRLRAAAAPLSSIARAVLSVAPAHLPPARAPPRI